jgi:hypothetical protein
MAQKSHLRYVNEWPLSGGAARLAAKFRLLGQDGAGFAVPNTGNKELVCGATVRIALS